MVQDSEDFFVPFVDEDGRVTGVMDQMTAEYLNSTESDPTQASLDEAFEGVTRVRLIGHREQPTVVEYDGQKYEAIEVISDVVRLDVTDRASVAELACALRVLEADEFGHVMSPGLNLLELWTGDRHAHTLVLVGWDTIRWSVWKGDASLAEPRLLEEWLLGHGITDAREEREEDEEDEEEALLRHREDWERAMPPSLRPLWPKRLGDVDPDIDAARGLLEAAIPDLIERVRALYAWLGSGFGRWSECPAYESAAEQLLLSYPIEVLLAALDAATEDEAALYGAARLFSRIREEDRQRCPQPLRRRMLDAVEEYSIRDNYRRFRSAFGLPDS